MVVMNTKTVEREMARRGWVELDLQKAMGVSHETMRQMFLGSPVGHKVHCALFSAFGGHIPLAKLFRVTVEAPAAAPQTTETQEATV